MTRLLALMGSGETTPTMVETHKRLLAHVSGPAVMVDTPYGFQENAPDLTARTLSYFDRNVGVEVGVVELRDTWAMGPAALEAAVARVEDAGWVFAGPGSPTYLLRQWQATRLPDVLRARLAGGGVMVFASAAACTLGRFAIPVYEIYKVGEPPHWREGLDVLSAIGLDVVVVPHFDNAEGGNHDTRFCYLGERRLLALEAELPDGVGVVGIDEHTAAILDLDAGVVRVEGRGALTARIAGRQRQWSAGTTCTLDELRAALDASQVAPAEPTAATAPSPEGVSPATSATPVTDEAARLRATFRARLERGEAVTASEAVLELADLLVSWSSDPNQSGELPAARRLLHELVVALATTAEAGMHDHRDLVAPHVETLLDLRDQARKDRDFAAADRIRDVLASGGVQVHDTPDGVDWEFDDPTGA